MKKYNGIKYNNGRFSSGKITPKLRKEFKIPACDTIFLRLERNGQDTMFATFTYDEAAGVVMILSETVWYNMPRKNRYKKGHQDSKW